MNMIKIGHNAERHTAKYEGSNNEDYVRFARQTAMKVQVSKMDTEVCKILGLYSVAHLVHTQLEIEYYIDEFEAEKYIIDHSNNALQLGLLWLKLKADTDAICDKMSVIDAYLSPFPKESFRRFGDVNWLKDVWKGWFSEKGICLDVQAIEIREVGGISVEIDDLISFVMNYKRGEYKSETVKMKEKIEVKWKDLFGFGIRDYYVEHLMKISNYSNVLGDVYVPF
jgi:hypothetical protein